MIIISFVATKGGVGKTTLTQNYAEWLASKGKKVLIVDSDHQVNVTQYYEYFEQDGTIKEIFSTNKADGDNVKLIPLKENLYLLPGSADLEDANTLIQSKFNKELLFRKWLSDNYYDRLEDFDFIIIDSHPDFSTITQNMIAASDIIISPVEPSEYGYNGVHNLKLRFNKLREEMVMPDENSTPLIRGKLYFMANKIKAKFNSSKGLLQAMESEEYALPFYLPYKEVVNKTTLDHISLVDAQHLSVYRKDNIEFFETMNKVFTEITKLGEVG